MNGLADSFRNATVKWMNDFKLTWVAATGDNQAVRSLLDGGANVHTGNDCALLSAVRGYCRRHWAGSAAERREDTLRALLEAGADIHARHDRALRIAVSLRRTDAVKILLEAGADIHSLSRLERRRLERLYTEDKLAGAIVRDATRQDRPAPTPFA
jgi:ankyrin repeat protein